MCLIVGSPSFGIATSNVERSNGVVYLAGKIPTMSEQGMNGMGMSNNMGFGGMNGMGMSNNNMFNGNGQY